VLVIITPKETSSSSLPPPPPPLPPPPPPTAAAIHVYPRAAAAIELKSHPFFFKLRENDTGKTTDSLNVKHCDLKKYGKNPICFFIQ